MNILIISYFSKSGVVGSMRIRFWEKSFSQKKIPVTVWTAENEDSANYIHIPPQRKKRKLNLIKDPGLDWKNSLEDYIKKNKELNYSHVIITGGPFMHFGISNLLKRTFNAKIILDYRDPFANNPRFQSSWLKIFIKRLFEKKFNKNADIITVVNAYMKSQIRSEKVHIIENGYDLDFFHRIQNNKNKELTFIHPGKLYDLPTIRLFIDALKNRKNIKFKYFGENFQESIFKHVFIDSNSTVSYSKIAEEIKKSDIGLILTKGHPFESTTKIYDYIGANIKILIITKGEKETGSLYEITKDYPNVYWAKDNIDDLNRAIEYIEKKKVEEYDSSHLSRQYSFEKLLCLIKNQ